MLHVSDNDSETELDPTIKAAQADNYTTPRPPVTVTQVTAAPTMSTADTMKVSTMSDTGNSATPLLTEPSVDHGVTTDATVATTSHVTMAATVPPLHAATLMPNTTKSEV